MTLPKQMKNKLLLLKILGITLFPPLPPYPWKQQKSLLAGYIFRKKVSWRHTTLSTKGILGFVCWRLAVTGVQLTPDNLLGKTKKQ